MMRKGLLLAAVVAILVPAMGRRGRTRGRRWAVEEVPISFTGGPGDAAPELVATACDPPIVRLPPIAQRWHGHR